MEPAYHLNLEEEAYHIKLDEEQSPKDTANDNTVAFSMSNYPVVPQEEIKEFLLVLGDKYRAVRRLRHTGSRSSFKSYFK